MRRNFYSEMSLMRTDLKLVAAIDRNNGIGKRSGELLFHIPEDMKRFRTLTMGNTVIVGRKTLETFPDKKPLPNRKTIVLSRQRPEDNGAVYCRNISELVAVIEELKGDIFVIGGGEVYRQLIGFCDTLYITRVDADGNGEVFLDELDKTWVIKEISEKKVHNSLEFWFEMYTKA